VLGINGSEFLVLIAVAAVVLGPERLPQYTQQLTRLIRELRRMAQGAQEKVREELGPEFDDVDWRKLDPRQYDPRRIVREALSDAVDLDDPLGLRDRPDDDRDAREDRAGRNGRANGSGSSTEQYDHRDRYLEPDTDPAAPAPAFDPDAT
jgi:sec-independent protein translocase protein TatB